MLGMLHKQLGMRRNVQKTDMLRHNSSLPLFWLWRCLARFWSSFGSEVRTIGWYLSKIKLSIFSLQEAPGALFHHSTRGIVTYSFSRALGMLYFGVRPRIIYGCIERWTLYYTPLDAHKSLRAPTSRARLALVFRIVFLISRSPGRCYPLSCDKC